MGLPPETEGPVFDESPFAGASGRALPRATAWLNLPAILWTLPRSSRISPTKPGAELVQTLLIHAETRRVEIFASFMRYMETLYRLWRQHGEKEGKLAYLRLKAWQ